MNFAESLEFYRAEVQAICPPGTAIGGWFDPLDELSKCAVVELRGRRALAKIPYYEGITETNMLERLELVKDAVRLALLELTFERRPLS